MPLSSCCLWLHLRDVVMPYSMVHVLSSSLLLVSLEVELGVLSLSPM